MVSPLIRNVQKIQNTLEVVYELKQCICLPWVIQINIFQRLSEFKEIHWRRQWHPTPVLLPGKSHGWRSLVGCSPWGREESDTTEQLHFHFSLSCLGEGNGNPLQCSCLENPRDGGAWWAAICGVAQSRTRLKWLSSSSKEIYIYFENLDQMPTRYKAQYWVWFKASYKENHILSVLSIIFQPEVLKIILNHYYH